MGSNLFYAAAFPVVQNQPYSANVLTQEIKDKPGEKSISHEAFNIHMRDSAGRIRDESLASPVDALGVSFQGEVHIFDPVAMRYIQWNEETKEVIVGDIPATFADYRGSPILNCRQRIQTAYDDNISPDPTHDHVSYEDIGERDIEGIHALGCRITHEIAQSGSVVTEIWSSPELQINLLTTESYSNGTHRLTKLTNIRRNEPDPALFQIPAGYADPVIIPKPAMR